MTPSKTVPPRGAGVFVIALLALAGCKKQAARTEPPGPLVRTVVVEGNKGLSDETIVEHLNLQPTSPVTFGDRSYFLPGLDDVDETRVEEVYDAHGFYDADVIEFDVRLERTDKKVRRQRAHVTIEVDEGEPTRVRNLDFEWSGSTVSPQARRELEAVCALRPGARFGVVPLDDARREIVVALNNAGYAYAVVEEHAQVDTEARLADVNFRIVPGEHKTIVGIEVRGLQRVPERLVVREVDHAIGMAYSLRRVNEVESGIYGMGVFATVSVAPGPEKPGPEMTLVAKVTESKMQRIKLGLGIQIDPVRWQQHATAQYEHANLFGKLYGLRARARAGYAELPTLYSPKQHGPIAGLELELRKTGLLEKRLTWSESPGFELGIWEGYQFYSVTNRIGVSRFFTRYFELGLSYNNRFVDLFDIQSTLDQNRTVLGLDFRDPYFLAFFQVVPTVHLTDDIVDPKNGARLSVSYDLANRFFGGQFDYHRVEPDLRGYYRPHERIQLAARARVGMAVPYGARAGVPIDQKFYLGGSTDVRGWPLRRLSPRVSLCPDDPTSCRGTAVGGLSMVNGSFELRVRTVKDLWLAGFVDMGDVRQGVLSFDPDGWLYTTGGGMRYHSQVGIFRLDAGYQLNTDPRFPEPRRWAIHFGIGETF